MNQGLQNMLDGDGGEGMGLARTGREGGGKLENPFYPSSGLSPSSKPSTPCTNRQKQQKMAAVGVLQQPHTSQGAWGGGCSQETQQLTSHLKTLTPLHR
jgi:hypothetical protein